jgi:predicted HTH transcriptional regulator
MTVEFKSDRARLPDAELLLTVVCLANSDGGEIYLGVGARKAAAYSLADATASERKKGRAHH